MGQTAWLDEAVQKAKEKYQGQRALEEQGGCLLRVSEWKA